MHRAKSLPTKMMAPLDRPQRMRQRVTSTLRFDWMMILLSAWMIAGVHLDAWAHHQVEVETFFTPWHAVLYSGFGAVTVFLTAAGLRGRTQRRAWRAALPAGYRLSWLGVLIFLAGGIGDMLWHTLIGIEVGAEALLSPPHLLLGIGGGFIVTGPLRAAWRRTGVQESTGREGDGSLLSLLPALLSVALLMALLSFFTLYVHPLGEMAPWALRTTDPAQQSLAPGVGIASILLQTALMMGPILLLVRRWPLPFGSLTVVLTVSSLFTVAIHEYFALLPFVIVAGLIADGLQAALPPAQERPSSLRWFAFSVPVIFYGLYFITLQVAGQLAWSIPLWSGALLLAGLIGWLLSFAFVAPANA